MKLSHYVSKFWLFMKMNRNEFNFHAFVSHRLFISNSFERLSQSRIRENYEKLFINIKNAQTQSIKEYLS